MKKMYFIFLLFLISINLVAQKIDCEPSYLGLSFIFKYPDKLLNLTSDMPENVMKSYIRMDSLFKIDNFDSFGAIKPGNNNYKFMLDYYTLSDYNPVQFFVDEFYHENNKTFGGRKVKVEIAMKEYLKNKPFIQRIFFSDHIYHIKVIDTIRRFNPWWNNETYLIEARIIDKLKGNTVPGYKDTRIPSDNEGHIDQFPLYRKVAKDSIIQFQYCIGKNHLVGYDKHFLIRDDGTQWLHKEKEYLVFFKNASACGKDGGEYRYFLNNAYFADSNYCLMYEIKDGVLIDDYDEFGFGKNIPVEEWKMKFRKLVQSYFDGNPIDVEEKIENDNFIIYPNPVKVGEKIHLNQNFNFIKMIDLYGRSIQFEQNGNEIIIPDNIMPGCYLLQIYYDNHILVKKLILTNG